MSAIVDLSELHDEEDLRGFMLAFVERLRAKPPANLHLVVDEADEFCPQIAPDSVGYRLIRQMTWIAKRGRLRGFVLTAITQRPADIANAVLSQMQTIVAHRLILPHDQDAIDRYLKRHASKDVRAEVMGSLAALARGERWIYSPAEARLERGISPLLTTFDSSSTPVAGEKRALPLPSGEIDIAAIRAALARPAAGASANASPTDVDRRVFELEEEAAGLRTELHAATVRSEQYEAGLGIIEELLVAVRDGKPWPNLQPENAGSAATTDLGTTRGAAAKRRPCVADAPPPAPLSGGGASGLLPGHGAREMLGLLIVLHPEGVSWADLALLAVRSPQGGAINVDRKALRTAGLVEERDGLVYALKSTATWAAASPVGLPRPAELRERWSAKLGRVPRAIIELLGDTLTGTAPTAAIGAATGRATRGGSWNVALKALRTANVAHLNDGELALHRFMVDPA
ncbi:hypothetical protein [Sphingomonas profundi]|uniref:hypothetical protein n=1 Tax=Alterirhizorhabdus profundi TaxID=2681549 RepID=UPI001E2EE705|nr:hypothetical protein [Sphingomonas profundi]